MSCTFDFANELCPIKINNKWRIQEGIQTDQLRPIVDHTRGGKLESFILLFFSSNIRHLFQ